MTGGPTQLTVMVFPGVQKTTWTRDAVAKYQIANHLNVTGSLSPDTLTSLGLQQATPS